MRRLIQAGDARLNSRTLAARVAVLAGIIFIPAGLVKFVFHGWELNAFRSFGLPWPSALELLAGVLEVLGGVLLVWRRAVIPTAVVLAITMVVAIAASGIGHGDVIPSLTLAPMLLAMLLYVLAAATATSGSPTPIR